MPKKPLTEQDLYLYKLHSRITFLETTMQLILKAVAQSQPEPRQALEDWANIVRSRIAGMRFEGANPAVSDMLAAEYQEAVERFLKDLLAD